MISKAEILSLIQASLIQYNNNILKKIYTEKNNVLEKNNKEYYVPTDSYHPATKSYVDETLANIEGGGTIDISFKADKTYVDQQLAKKINIEGHILTDNNYTTVEKNKLANIESNANNYIHPSNHEASIITQDLTHRFVTDEEKTRWNNKSNFSGSYNDLKNKPTIPTKVSQLTNDVEYTTKTYVDQKIEDSITDETIDLSNYYNKTQVDDKLTTKAEKVHTHNEYLTGIPTEYVTDTELASKGYLTKHQDISHLATKSELSSKANISHTHNEYLTQHQDISHLALKTEIPTKTSDLTNDSSFVDKKYVDEAIVDAITDGTIDLSNYALKTDLDSKADLDHSHSELHIHDNKLDLDKITDTKISEWNNKSEFSGDYVDLINKPTLSSFEYSNPEFPDIKNLQDAMDKIFYVSPTITSFTASKQFGIYEIGSIIEGPITFTWQYNKNIISQSFNDTVLDNSIRTTDYNSNITSNKTFTIKGSDGKNNTSKSLSYKFQHKRYWGAALEPIEYNNKFILSLPNSEFCTSRVKSAFSSNMGGPKQYFYYCYPESFGEAVFNVGGFDGGFEKIATIKFANASGHEESFVIFKSENENLGDNTIQVK